MTDDAGRQLISVEEAAVLMERSVKTVWRLIKAGKLTRRTALGRTYVDRGEVLRLMEPK